MKIYKISTKLLIALAAFGLIGCSNDTPGGMQKAQIENIIKNYLDQNPEVIIQALQNFQQKQIDQTRKSIQKTQEIAPKFYQQIFHQNVDPALGDPNGAVTITQFFDYQCTHCVHMVPVIDAILKANPNIKVIYKEFPIRGPISEEASKAALAAQMQGKYIQFHHGLMKVKEQPLNEKAIFDVATQVGLDVEKLKKDMKDPAVQEQIKNNTKLGQDLQLIGTPAFFIAKTNNGSTTVEFIPGQMDQSQLQGLVDKMKH